MKFFAISFIVATIFNHATAQEQTTPVSAESASKEISDTKTYPLWSIGISGTVIDDDGETFSSLFNVSDSWNFLPYPTRLHVDMAIDGQWSFEAAVTYNMLQKGKVFNDNLLDKDYMFIAFDANAKFHFLKNSKIFDPYGVGGLGFTYRSALQEQTPTLNVGVGANIWFVPNFGLTLQSTAKVKLNSKSSNYLLHSVGVVYRFIK